MTDKPFGQSPSTRRRNIAKRVKCHMSNLQQSVFNIHNNLRPVSSNTLNVVNSGDLSTPLTSSNESSEKELLDSTCFNQVFCNFSSSSESSHDSSQPSFIDFKKFLMKWALQYNITTTALTDLLKMLRLFDTFKQLPKDGRTFLKTNSLVKSKNIGDGKFAYFGLARNIERQLDIVSPEDYMHMQQLDLEISVDGLPISKSTREQLWPIQCSIINLVEKLKPFVVGVYYGMSKPADVGEYFIDLLNELKELQIEGISINSKLFLVKLVRIVADAPARSFVKQCKIHNAYNSCEKCVVKGIYSGRVIFPDLNCELRTDVDFLAQTDKIHHTGVSPFTQINFGLVTGVPLDYMHLVCLGVTKKLLRAWVKGPIPYRIPAKFVLQISNSLSELSSTCPKEFSRKPRSLRELDMWKATEFRSFLLYTGPVVLKNVLPTKQYKHFMLLSVAITILISPCAQNLEWNKYAQNLLYNFVKSMNHLYSSEFLVYNVHSLIHLCNDVLLHGPLDSFSAFKYESNMQCIKRTLRAKYKPFEQVVNRISELDYIMQTRYENLTCIKTTSGNNCFITKNGSVIIIINIDGQNLYCKKFSEQNSFYKKPCDSTLLRIYLLSDLLNDTFVIDRNEISLKCWLMPYENCYVSVPLVNCKLIN